MLENPTGGGVKSYGNPDVRGGSSSFGIPSGRGGGVKETCIPSWRCGFFLDKCSHQSVIPWFSIFTPVSASVSFSFGALRMWPSSSSVTKKTTTSIYQERNIHLGGNRSLSMEFLLKFQDAQTCLRDVPPSASGKFKVTIHCFFLSTSSKANQSDWIWMTTWWASWELNSWKWTKLHVA